MIDLCVPVYFHGNFHASQVVYCRNDLCEAALAKYFNNLKSVEDLIFWLNDVVTICIV